MVRVAFPLNTTHEFEGIKVLSACLKDEGHETRVFLESEEKDLRGAVGEWGPDMVGLYATTGQHPWAYGHVRAWKAENRDLKVVMGGPHPSFEPEDALAETDVIDAITIAESEGAMVDLTEAWAAGRPVRDIPNVGVWEDGHAHVNPIRPVIHDLDSLPLPDADAFYRYPFLAKKNVLQLMATRGCQNSCTYCSVGLMKKEWVSGSAGEKFNRTKSVDYLIEEVRDVLSRWPRFRIVNFGDAALNLSLGWLEEFSRKWPDKIGMPFACNVNINFLDEKEIVWLKRSGCVSVQFGLESGSERVRTRVYHKHYTDEMVERVPRLLHKHRISFRTNNMLGSPSETLDDMFETVAVNKRIKSDGCTVLIFRPFLSTEMGRELHAEGRVDTEKDIGPSIHFDSEMKDVGDDVINLHRLFNVAVRLPFGVPLVRRLIRLPKNRLFDFCHLWSLWWQHATVSGYGLVHDTLLGFKNLGQILGNRLKHQTSGSRSGTLTARAVEAASHAASEAPKGGWLSSW